jgi:3-hydroxyisobutyrate dehydrogenase
MITTQKPNALRIGFAGLGHMGEPMATRIVKALGLLNVWNRSPEKCAALAELGATPCASMQELADKSDAIILMLATEQAMNDTLQRGTPAFEQLVRGRIIVHMGTTSPSYSQALGEDVRSAGGAYVEAPVSGSRVPAQRGELVGMVAGDAVHIEAITPALNAMCRKLFVCGQPPQALMMKIAVNHYLITTVTALVEAFHFAESVGVDKQLWSDILCAGPMSSPVAQVKLDKLVRADYSPQASISDVFKNAQLIVDQARSHQVQSPLLDIAHSLFAQTLRDGFGQEDMVAVRHAYSGI